MFRGIQNAAAVSAAVHAGHSMMKGDENSAQEVPPEESHDTMRIDPKDPCEPAGSSLVPTQRNESLSLVVKVFHLFPPCVTIDAKNNENEESRCSPLPLN